MSDQMPRCRTCKWWDHEGKGWGRCDATVLTWDGKWEYPETKAVAQDWDDTSGAFLQTNMDFGCVQHEVKE